MRKVSILSLALVASAAAVFIPVSANAAIETPGTRCFADISQTLGESIAELLCATPTGHVTTCVDMAQSRELTPRQSAAVCLSATSATADCIDVASLRGLRGEQIVLSCHETRAQTATRFGATYLVPARGTHAAVLPGCDGVLDVSTDDVGRLRLEFVKAQGCAHFEIWSANHDRRLTGDLEVGDGPMRRSGEWIATHRVANFAAEGLLVKLFDERGHAKSRVLIQVAPTR